MSRRITKLIDKLLKTNAKENPDSGLIISQGSTIPNFAQNCVEIRIGHAGSSGSNASCTAAMGAAMAHFSKMDRWLEGDVEDQEWGFEVLKGIFADSLKRALEALGIDPTQNKTLHMVADVLCKATSEEEK